MSWSWQTKEEKVLAKKRLFTKGQKGAGCIGKTEKSVVIISAPNGNDWFPCLPPSPFPFTWGHSAQPKAWCSGGDRAGHMGLARKKDMACTLWNAHVESPTGWATIHFVIFLSQSPSDFFF